MNLNILPNQPNFQAKVDIRGAKAKLLSNEQRGAIEKFAENFKKVMDDKNKIEREKLAFEKEKFLKLSGNNEDNNEDSYEHSHEHEWILESRYQIPEDLECRWYYRYICNKCGAVKITTTDVL